MSDDVTKAKANVTHAKQERNQKAADFWDRTIVAGQQTEAGKAIEQERLKPTEKASRRLKSTAT